MAVLIDTDAISAVLQHVLAPVSSWGALMRYLDFDEEALRRLDALIEHPRPLPDRAIDAAILRRREASGPCELETRHKRERAGKAREMRGETRDAYNAYHREWNARRRAKMEAEVPELLESLRQKKRDYMKARYLRRKAATE